MLNRYPFSEFWMSNLGERGLPDFTLAVLIDADNTPYEAIKEILDASEKFGRIIIKRAYGDWTSPNLKNWGETFREYAVRPIQQFQYTTGKNSTDSAMLIDAMDILSQKRVHGFILVSSDSDFTGLATRIREEGLRVIGVGRRTTPLSFVKACEDFILIENLLMSSTFHSPKKATEIKSEGDFGKELLIRAVKNVADENGLVRGAELGMMLKKLDPAFDPVNYGVRKLSQFVGLHKDVLQSTDKKSGVDPIFQVVRR